MWQLAQLFARVWDAARPMLTSACDIALVSASCTQTSCEFNLFVLVTMPYLLSAIAVNLQLCSTHSPA